MTDPLLKPAALAARLSISLKSAYRLMERGDIAVTRIGTSVRVSEASLAEYVARNTAKPRAARKGAAA